MIPSLNQQLSPAATDASTTGRFADPAYRALVREQARRMKDMSTLPPQGELPAVLLLRHMEDMQHEWQRASQLGFRLADEELSGFRQQHQHLNVHDAPTLGKVALTAYGLTESVARAMDQQLPPNERLNVEWSSREAMYIVRLARGAISFVRGPGGTVQPQDTRILQFQRNSPR